MRYENFAENEHYHLFARGISQGKIFLDRQDYSRFIFLITHLQSPIRIYNIGWYTNRFLVKNSFNTQNTLASQIQKRRSIELEAFALMPNHFHLLVKNLGEGLISVYMHRVLTAYGKYFNAKYHKKGHVFEGPFKAVRVKKNDQLLHLSAYIHKNPKEIAEWANSYEKYPYSSYQDYLGPNRWGELLSPDLALRQFKNPQKYGEFVRTSTTKESIKALK